MKFKFSYCHVVGTLFNYESYKLTKGFSFLYLKFEVNEYHLHIITTYLTKIYIFSLKGRGVGGAGR